MHTIKKYESKITLLGVNGSRQTFQSIKDAYTHLSLLWISQNVGKHFVEFSHEELLPRRGEKDFSFRYGPVYKKMPFIMRDDAGNAVTYNDCYKDYLRNRNKSKAITSKYWMSIRSLEVWNCSGPVPNVKKLRGGKNKCESGLHFTSKRSEAECFIEEGEVFARYSQREKLVKHPYDSRPRWKKSQKSWKEHRKTQYK